MEIVSAMPLYPVNMPLSMTRRLPYSVMLQGNGLQPRATMPEGHKFCIDDVITPSVPFRAALWDKGCFQECRWQKWKVVTAYAGFTIERWFLVDVHHGDSQIQRLLPDANWFPLMTKMKKIAPHRMGHVVVYLPPITKLTLPDNFQVTDLIMTSADVVQQEVVQFGSLAHLAEFVPGSYLEMNAIQSRYGMSTFTATSSHVVTNLLALTSDLNIDSSFEDMEAINEWIFSGDGHGKLDLISYTTAHPMLINDHLARFVHHGCWPTSFMARYVLPHARIDNIIMSPPDCVTRHAIWDEYKLFEYINTISTASVATGADMFTYTISLGQVPLHEHGMCNCDRVDLTKVIRSYSEKTDRDPDVCEYQLFTHAAYRMLTAINDFDKRITTISVHKRDDEILVINFPGFPEFTLTIDLYVFILIGPGLFRIPRVIRA